MFMQIIRRMRLAVDRTLSRTKPMGPVNQTMCGLVLTEQIYDDATKKNKNRGEVLYNYLPSEIATTLVNTPFDPYDLDPTERYIREWLWDHVVFDGNGYIIALHNRGEILACVDGCEREAATFSRLRLGDVNG